MSIKAIIYDVDGTLVDSEPLHVKAWDETLKLYRHTLTDLSQTFQNTMAGKKPIIIAEGMVEELNIKTDPADFLAEKSKLFLELARTQLQPMEGAVESVHRFKQAGYKLGIGTSLDRAYLDLILYRLDVVNIFDVIVTGDQITKGKPDPETYLTVAEQLGVSAEQCVVLEDAATGVASAKAAGMVCIAIENANAVAQDLGAADMIVNSLNEVTEGFIKELN